MVFPNFWQALLYNYILPIIIGIAVLLLIFKGAVPTELYTFNSNLGHLFTIPFLLFFLWKSKIKISWSEFTNISINKILVIILLTVSIEFIFYGTTILFERLFDRNYPNFSTKPTHFLSVIHALVAAPVIEEILYRRIFVHQFLKQYSFWVAITFSSILFVIPHVPTIIFPELFIPFFIGGLFLGFVYYKTQSVLLCIISHFIMNAITYLPIHKLF